MEKKAVISIRTSEDGYLRDVYVTLEATTVVDDIAGVPAAAFRGDRGFYARYSQTFDDDAERIKALDLEIVNTVRVKEALYRDYITKLKELLSELGYTIEFVSDC